MKLSRFITTVLKSHSHYYPKNVVGLSFYSNTAAPYSKRSSDGVLYRRLSPLGDPKVSIVPVLDQWIQEGKPVQKDELHAIIKQLRRFRRFKHALEMSMWMSDKKYMELTTRDIAIRLDLISKAHGIEQAEQYFETIPMKLRKLEVYGALLNCYAHVDSVEKAEATMQTMRDLGLAKTSLCYNVLLSLYHRTGNHEKAGSLIKEMEEKGIASDAYTISIRLSAYAATPDIGGVEKVMTEIENNPTAVLDWSNYSIAANGYIRAGVIEKALAMLKKSEELIKTGKNGKKKYEFLLTQYAAIGKKDELLRLWEDYKNNEKIYNRAYMTMISSVLKCDDIEWAERVFEEWESRELSFDIRIPNFLIGAYCRKSLLDKAENLLNKISLEGYKPDAFSWYYLATGFLQDHQTPKAVEAMKEALSICQQKWKPRKEFLSACLEYLKEKGDLDEAEEFISLLKVKEIVSSDTHDGLLNYIKGVGSNLLALNQMDRGEEECQ